MERGPNHLQHHQAIERSAEQQRTERIVRMLSPRGGEGEDPNVRRRLLQASRDLGQFIEEVVFEGETDTRKREAKLRDAGIEPRDLVGYGREVIDRIENLERFRVPDARKEQALERLKGLRDSVVAEERSFREDDYFQLDLRWELTRLLRKWIVAIATADEANREDTFYNQIDTAVYQNYIEAYRTLRLKNPGEFSAREEHLLSLADDEAERKKIAFIRDVARKLESFIESRPSG